MSRAYVTSMVVIAAAIVIFTLCPLWALFTWVGFVLAGWCWAQIEQAAINRARERRIWQRIRREAFCGSHVRIIERRFDR